MPLSRRRFLATGAAAFGASAFGAVALAADTADLLQIEGPAFGAGWRVRVAAGADAGAIIRAITGVIDRIDAQMSPFRPHSEISRFNLAETTARLPLSPGILRTLAEAQRIAAQTEGAFDPTLGGLVGRYGFGPITRMPQGAFADLRLNADGAAKAHAQQTLDLCGIAKGHALDQCTAALRSIGLQGFFIELGGEVAASGAKPDGSPWRAGVERPLPGPAAAHCVVALRGEALATSGDLIHSYVLNGHRYSHIIDPQQGTPADSALASVSVFAPQAITADALATALFAMGAERGPTFAEALALDALFLARDGQSLRAVMTGRFVDRIIAG